MGRWAVVLLGALGACVPTKRPVGEHLVCQADGCICAQGFDDCDQSEHSGCETPTDADPKNCGACGVACHAPCQAATCVVATCDEGYADCNDAVEDGCEAQLAADAAHCGACGHDCGEGRCDAGHCAPYELVAQGLYAYGIAVAQDEVFFCEGISGAILRASIPGGDIEVFAADQRCAVSPEPATGLSALGGGYLYWVTEQYVPDGAIGYYLQRVVRAPVAGGAPEVVPDTELVDDQVVQLVIGDGVIVRLVLAGSSRRVELIDQLGVVVLAEGPELGRLTLLGGRVYWIAPASAPPASGVDSAVSYADLDTLETGLSALGRGIAHLSENGEHLYWAGTVKDTGRHTVNELAVATSEQRVVHESARPLHNLMPGPKQVFWTESINGIGIGIVGVALPSGPPVLYSNSHYVYEAADSDSMIVWADYADRLFALRK